MSLRINRINQLDSLRALAAFCVILHHFIREYNLGSFPSGWIGVDVFFVISGYLITAILLEEKENIQNKLLVIKNFIIKRTLRLFPIYYLFISFFVILSCFFGFHIAYKADWIFYYTYTQNILLFKEGWKAVQLNHLWTLAVEEQFYLVWPWLVLYISNKNLFRVLFFFIISSLFFKSFSQLEGLRFLPFSHFDTLGIGALISLVVKQKKEHILLFINKFKKISIPCSAFIIILSSIYYIPSLCVFLSVLILSSCLLIGCYFKFDSYVGKILNIPVLQHLGKISYGLYLYHKPIPYFMKCFTSKMTFQLSNVILFILSILLTVLVAQASYSLIEKRCLILKSKFDL